MLRLINGQSLRCAAPRGRHISSMISLHQRLIEAERMKPETVEEAGLGEVRRSDS